jgi:polysaccharide export outer membrane protein
MHRLALVIAVASVLAVASLSSSALAQGNPAQGAPVVTGITLPSDYVIGAEDVLGVLFWREQEMSGDVVVRPDGMVTLPLIGELKAAGLKPEAVRDAIQAAATKFLADANVTVVVRQINSRKVFITGQVARPGEFPLASPRTVLQLIALSGGLTEYAEGDKVTIMRTDGAATQTLRFNYKEVTKGKKIEQNILLKPGDTVVVP